MTSNQIKYWTLVETKRSNVVRDRETERHNKATERIQDRQVYLNYSLGLQNLAETRRSNMARESELNRHNVATEMLTAQELGIKSQQLLLNMRDLDIKQYQAETGRMNVGLGYAQLAELQQHNRATERLSLDQLTETLRSNMAREKQNTLNNMTSTVLGAANISLQAGKLQLEGHRLDLISEQQEEQARHNLAVEEETNRNNSLNGELRALELEHKINNETARLQVDIIDRLLLKGSTSILKGVGAYVTKTN